MSEYKFLTESDLNDFKLKLNDLNDNLTRSGKKLIIAKSKFAKREVNKDFVKEYENYYKEAKKQFNEGCKNDLFQQNLYEAKKLYNSVNKNDSNFKEILNNYKVAKKLYKGYKEAVKERGFGGELSALNNVALKLQNIKFKYRENHPFAVDDVSIEIEHGNYIAIIGHNGSGKSTLSKIIIGVLEPTQGSIEVYGNKVTKSNINIIRKFLGIVFQNPDNQFIGSTVRDDIAFGLENRRIEPSKMNDIIVNAAKKVNMENFLDHEPLMLSGGQKQRVAIASALALSPNILIFDEATSMLDPKGKSEVKQIMVELKKTREKTIFSITHDMDEILNADKVMVMNKGKLVSFGTPKEILSDKNFLRSIHLDIPFVAQVEEALQNLGLDISGSENLDELVDKICQI
ncbi:energy-coupling factor transporter ATPase [Spiroplasma turonicum]|uniref:Cobalt ABC transporter ATP-binding subunit n=1 Tax=Spiroplasma turonicum TaxID=216946 RepID=A0A0K1P8L3_9MOLU|nr:energy-coupling factor transporter ATPase [Spiroplasma turonicum]AKU80242.1 cobalt ABC transporter ATP-binding subunit [Spiroplasma turonicum]ALX71242.1 cobalt ABC transporter ATP-binding subunit [Spiroplasma turonicum]